MVGPGFSLCPLRNHQATVTPLQRVPKLPKILLEIQERRQGLCGELLPWGSPSPSTSDLPVPCERQNQICRGKRKSPAMSYTALGSQPQDMVQMPCENPALSISLGKKRDGATEAPIWDHLVSLSFAPAVPAPMNIPFGCKKKVSCSSEQSEGTWEQQDGVRAEATTGTSRGVTPARLPICLTQHLWGKKTH